MDEQHAIRILEAMVDGCDPMTGEALPADHLLLNEQVLEALLLAMEAMRAQPAAAAVELADDDLHAAVAEFRALGINPTANRVAGFLALDKRIKEPELLGHPLYGKYARRYGKDRILPTVEEWLTAHQILQPRGPEGDRLPHPYFNPPHFLNLTDRAIEQLREKVAAIPLQRVEGLSEQLIERRKIWARSHEPWPEEEQRLLKRALEFTNDLAFLSSAFGRSETAISAQAERILGEGGAQS